MGLGNRLRLTVVLAATCVLPLLAAAQQPAQTQQSSSVADAARRAREQKKNSAKPTKVITDENLSSNLKPGPDGVNVMAPPTTGADGSAAAATNPAATDQPAGQGAENSVTGEDVEIAKLKEQVAQTEKELDLLKREFALDSEAYYSKTGYSSDKAGKAKLDGEQQQIGDKQQELERLKTRLAALEELNRRRSKSGPASSNIQGDKSSTPRP